MKIYRLSTIYFFIFGISIILYSLNLITILSPISFKFILYSFFIPLTIIFVLELSLWRGNKPRKFELSFKLNKEKLEILDKRIKSLFVFWIIFSAIDLMVSGFIPLIAAFNGSSLNYAMYGVRGLGGTLNAAAMALSFSFSYLYSLNIAKRDQLFKFSILMIWQLLTLRRGILISLFLIFFITFLLIKRKSLWKLLKLASLSILTIIISFGMIGDIRGHSNPFASIVRSEHKELFEILPSGFLWVYVYITSSLENLNNNLNALNGECFDILGPLKMIIPSILRPKGSCSFYLETEYLNVSSYLSNYVSTGFFPSYFIFLTLPIVLTIISRRNFLITKKAKYFGIYIIFSLCWLFSPFTNLFYLPTYILSPLLINYTFRNL